MHMAHTALVPQSEHEPMPLAEVESLNHWITRGSSTSVILMKSFNISKSQIPHL